MYRTGHKDSTDVTEDKKSSKYNTQRKYLTFNAGRRPSRKLRQTGRFKGGKYFHRI
jgi:hypothetical protein